MGSFERLPVDATVIFFGRVAVLALAQLRRICMLRLPSANRNAGYVKILRILTGVGSSQRGHTGVILRTSLAA